MVNVGGLIFWVMVTVAMWVEGLNRAWLFKWDNVEAKGCGAQKGESQGGLSGSWLGLWAAVPAVSASLVWQGNTYPTRGALENACVGLWSLELGSIAASVAAAGAMAAWGACCGGFF